MVGAKKIPNKNARTETQFDSGGILILVVQLTLTEVTFWDERERETDEHLGIGISFWHKGSAC